MASVTRTNREEMGVTQAPETPTSENLEKRVTFVAQRGLHEGSLQPLLFAQDGVSGGFLAIPNVIEDVTDYKQRHDPSTGKSTHSEKVAKSELGGLNMINGVITVALGVFQGQRGAQTLKVAARTEDSVSASVGFARLTRAPADVIRGAANVAKGVSSIVEAATNVTEGAASIVNTTTKLSKAAQAVSVAGKIASAGSLVSATGLLVLNASYLHETRMIHQGMNKAGSSAVEKVKYLQDLRTLDSASKETIVETVLNGGQTGNVATRLANKLFGPKEDLMTKALKFLLQHPNNESALRVLQKEFAKEALSEVAHQDSGLIDAKVRNYVSANYNTETREFKEKLAKALQGLCQNTINNELERKQNVFARAVGSDTIKALDALQGNSLDETQAQAIVKTAELGFKWAEGMGGVAIALCILWIGLTIAAFILTGGVSAIIEAVVGFTVSALSAGVDGYYLYQEYKEKQLVSKDKVFLFSFSLLTSIGAALAIGAAKSVAGKVTAGLSSFAWIGYLLWSVWGRKSEETPAPRSATPTDEGYTSGEPNERTPLLNMV